VKTGFLEMYYYVILKLFNLIIKIEKSLIKLRIAVAAF